jgi:hypothetical protein
MLGLVWWLWQRTNRFLEKQTRYIQQTVEPDVLPVNMTEDFLPYDSIAARRFYVDRVMPCCKAKSFRELSHTNLECGECGRCWNVVNSGISTLRAIQEVPNRSLDYSKFPKEEVAA